MPGAAIEKTSPHRSPTPPMAVVYSVMPSRELTASFLLVWLFLACLDRPFIQAEKWTSLTGNRTVEATMVGMWDNQVVLVLAGGRKVNVPMDSLIAESRIQAGQIAARLEQQREALTSEIKKVAEEAAAPAPDPLPEPAPAPEYEAPAPGMSPEQTLQTISTQIQNGHVAVIYDALPPSYRKRIDALVQLTLTKLEPDALSQPLSQLHSLADLIVTRQNWILSHPRLLDSAGQKGDLNAAGEVIQKLVLPTANLVRAGIPADQAAIDAIEQIGFAKWLHQQDAAIAPYVAMLMESYSSPASQWSLLDSKEDTAILEMPGAISDSSASGPQSGSPDSSSDSSSSSSSSDSYSSSSDGSGGSNVAKNPTIAMKKVEGFWIPASVAEGFDAWAKEQNDALEQLDDATMNLSAWLGGQYVTVPTAPVDPEPDPNRFDGSSSSSEGYDDMRESSSSDPSSSDGSSSYSGSSSGYETSGNPTPKSLEPIAITPEMIGSILQSVSAYSSLAAPLQAATDASSFHQAAEQIVGSIEGMLSLLSGN